MLRAANACDGILLYELKKSFPEVFRSFALKKSAPGTFCGSEGGFEQFWGDERLLGALRGKPHGAMPD